MKNKVYRVRGDPENGHNISVPACVGAKAGDRYDFSIQQFRGRVLLPVGALVYVPVVE